MTRLQWREHQRGERLDRVRSGSSPSTAFSYVAIWINPRSSLGADVVDEQSLVVRVGCPGHRCRLLRGIRDEGLLARNGQELAEHPGHQFRPVRLEPVHVS